MRIAKCPYDSSAMGVVPASGEFEGSCDQCGQTFKILFGTVRRSNSRQEKIEGTQQWRRLTEIWLDREDGREEIIRFYTPGKDVRVSMRKGYDVTYAVRMPGYEPVYINNRTHNEPFWFMKPVPPPAKQAPGPILGLLVALFGFMGLVGSAGDGGTVAMGFGFIVVGVAVMAFSWPRQKKEEPKRDPTQEILAEVQRVDARIAELKHDTDRLRRARRKLVELASEMRDVGVEMYGARIEKMERGVKAIDQQLEDNDALFREYEKTRKMLGIEVKTIQTEGAVAAAMELIGKRKAEMKQLEQRSAEHRLQLEAIDEVERILAN